MACGGSAGGIQGAHLSVDSSRIGADLGFAALREAEAKEGEEELGRNTQHRLADVRFACSLQLPCGSGSLVIDTGTHYQ